MDAAGALAPIRVLLAGRDRRFLKVSGFLLARRGFVPETCLNPDDLMQLVDLYEPDVVVLDGSDAPAATARSVAALEALHPRIGVLVVADETHGDEGTPHILSKWGGLEWLAQEVEAIHARGWGHERVASSLR